MAGRVSIGAAQVAMNPSGASESAVVTTAAVNACNQVQEVLVAVNEIVSLVDELLNEELNADIGNANNVHTGEEKNKRDEIELSETVKWWEQADDLYSGLATCEWEDFKKDYAIEPTSSREWRKRYALQVAVPDSRQKNSTAQSLRVAEVADIGAVPSSRAAETKVKTVASINRSKEDEILSMADYVDLSNEAPPKQYLSLSVGTNAEPDSCMRLIKECEDFSTYEVKVDVLRPDETVSLEELMGPGNDSELISKETDDFAHSSFDNRSKEEIQTCLRKAFLLEPSSDIEELSDDEVLSECSQEDEISEIDEDKLFEFEFDENDELISVKKINIDSLDSGPITDEVKQRLPDDFARNQEKLAISKQFEIRKNKEPLDIPMEEQGQLVVKDFVTPKTKKPPDILTEEQGQLFVKNFLNQTP